MFKRLSCFTLMGLGLLVAGAATGLAWDEEEISLEQVPAPARAALLKLAGGAKITGVEREREGGMIFYEAEWEVDGRETEAKVTAGGDLIEMEEEVAASDVPAAVRAVVAKKFPNGAKVEYEKITLHFYEVEGQVAGMKMEILVSPAGKIVHAEEEHEDGDDDDEDDDDDHNHDDEDEDEDDDDD